MTPRPNSKSFSLPFFTRGCILTCQQLAVLARFAAQLSLRLDLLDGRATTTGSAAIHTLPFQLGLGEMEIQGCFNCWLVC